MAKSKKGGRPKKVQLEEKKKLLQNFWSSFQSECEEIENRMNSVCEETCTKICKTYADKLQKLPENIRKMTLTEYLEMVKQAEEAEIQQQKQTEESQSVLKLRSQYEKSKLESEKKKTLKKERIERKRSTSVSNFSASKFMPNMSSRNRVMSESCLNTPLSKVSVAPAFVVTPKFNPKAPLSKGCLRRPRAGELLMSLSGSPLHNFADDIPEKPGGVAVSLGGGKIIKITDDTEIANLENDFMKKLNEETKSTLASVKEKLDKILKS